MSKSTIPASQTKPLAAATGFPHAERPRGKEHVIRPVKRRVRVFDLWYAIPVIRVFVVRDFKSKYKQAVLGQLWLLIQPLGLLVGFVVVFNSVTKVDTGETPYVLFALTGLCVWSFFQGIISGAPTLFISTGELIRRVSFPRIALSFVVLFRILPVLAASLVFTLGAVVILGESLTWRIALLPVCLVWLAFLSWSMALMLATLSVRYRDPVSMVPFLLQIGLFLSPVAYPAAQVSGRVGKLIELNPLTAVIEAVRWSVISSGHFTALSVVSGVTLTVILACLAWYTFGRWEVTFADYV